MPKKIKIILVDDEVLFTGLYNERLKMAGYDILIENHAEKAIESIRKFAPDFVILDLMMPLVSGEDILDKMKADEKLKSIKVIILTALPKSDAERKKIEAKADEYLIKSEILPKDLVAKIEAMSS